MKLRPSGWLSGVRQVASPNHDARPSGCPVTMLVVHAISLPPDQFGGPEVEQFFTNALDISKHSYFQQLKDVRVSSHFFIRRNGQVVQFVSCGRRAWHAGVSSWKGRSRCNDFSIGVELEGCDTQPFDHRQYQALAKLTRVLRRTFPVTDIVGHVDIAPDRKTDPGPFFDWERYRRLL